MQLFDQEIYIIFFLKIGEICEHGIVVGNRQAGLIISETADHQGF